jgi:four helix bundle protein
MCEVSNFPKFSFDEAIPRIAASHKAIRVADNSSFQGSSTQRGSPHNGKQVLRSGTSVAANYRAVCRSRSKAEFTARLGVVVEEIDETMLWLELLTESEILPADRLRELRAEANELLAIFVTSQMTAKGVVVNAGPR